MAKGTASSSEQFITRQKRKQKHPRRFHRTSRHTVEEIEQIWKELQMESTPVPARKEPNGSMDTMDIGPEEKDSTIDKAHSMYEFMSYAKHDHRSPLYAISFCDSHEAYKNYFVAVGRNEVAIHQCLEDGDMEIVQIYQCDTEENLFTTVWTVDTLNDCPLVVVAGESGYIQVINIIHQSLSSVLSGHGNSINELKRHPQDPNLIFSASKDESIRLWNICTGTCVAIFSGHLGHRDEVLSIDIHFTGTCIASSGMDNTIRIWDLQEQSLQQAIQDSYLSPKAIGRPFKTKLLQVPSFYTSFVHSDYVDCVRFIGDLLLSKSTANKIILWRPKLTEGANDVVVVREYTCNNSDLWFIKFSLDFRQEKLASGNKLGEISIWDIDNDISQASCKLSHPNAKFTIRQTCFSVDGQSLVASCDDGTVWRWDKVGINRRLGLMLMFNWRLVSRK